MFQILQNTDREKSLLLYCVFSAPSFQSVFISSTILLNKLLLKKAKQIPMYAQMSSHWSGLERCPTQRGERTIGPWALISESPGLQFQTVACAQSWLSFFLTPNGFKLIFSQRTWQKHVRTTDGDFNLSNMGLFPWPGKFGRKALRKNKGTSETYICAACKRVMIFLW